MSEYILVVSTEFCHRELLIGEWIPEAREKPFDSDAFTTSGQLFAEQLDQPDLQRLRQDLHVIDGDVALATLSR